MTRLVLVRHGETVWHAENRYAGSSDIDLTDLGQDAVQAQVDQVVQDFTVHRALIEQAKASFVDGGSPFAGPVKDQDGEVLYAEGEQPTYEEIEQMDFFVEGVIGTIG